MVDRADAEAERIKQILESTDWRMKWEILPGIITPGISEVHPAYILDDYGVGSELKGKTALDIGTWDGAFAFELEKRGARTVATDIQDPNNTGFNAAKEILGSSIEYLQASVYELPKLLTLKFDIVLFRAIYYHLKNPIGAFEAIQSIMSDNGLAFIEGECLLYYAETTDDKPVFDGIIKQIASSNIPVTLCYPGTYKKGENWFVPNLACFEGWLAASGLTLLRHRFWEDRSTPSSSGQRIIAVAERNVGSAPKTEHSVLGHHWRRRIES